MGARAAEILAVEKKHPGYVAREDTLRHDTEGTI
jgi:hypothetical protein